MKLGIGNHATDTELRVQDMTFGEFADKLSRPKIGQKDGLYVVRGGLLKEPKRADANLIEAELIVVDGDSRFDPETGEVLSGAPDFDVTCEAFKSLGVPFVLHTTHSNQPGKPKWRGYIPAVMSSPAELSACVGAVIEHLNGAGCFVVQSKECTTWSQAWFTPRVPSPEALEWFRFHAATEGNSFNVPAAVAVAQRQALTEEAVERVQAAPKPTPNANGPSPIESFNASATIETVRYMLEQAGYKLAYRRGDTLRMIAPGSETGTAGVHVFKGRQRGDIVAYSHHGGHDPLSGRLNDAFGVLTRVRHKGDQDAAIAEAKAVVGWASRRDPTEGFEVEPTDFEDASRPRISDSSDINLLEEGDREANFITDARGFLIPNAHNIAELLITDEEFAGIFANDTFANKRVLLRQLPNVRGPREFNKPIQMTEMHLSAILARVQRRAMPKATKAMVCDALELVFAETEIHPVRNYLVDLKWDGVGRLDTWLKYYLGAAPTDTEGDDYLSAVGVAWMVSAVARIFRPGCKADSALILEGGQGIGKSTTASVLAGEWFGDALPHMGTKDASSYLQGLWIVELAELANMARAEVEIVKSFMSRTEDRFRPAYARLEVSVPRQCVFIGSTNATHYLRDQTGNRRFWPVRCGEINIDALKEDRDQLWAEAVHSFNNGFAWWLDRDVAETANKVQRERVDNDEPLAQQILDYTLGKEQKGVCIAQIVASIFSDVRDRNLAISTRVGKFLRSEGWEVRGLMPKSAGHGSAARYMKDVK